MEEYMNIKMPIEFEEICKLPKFEYKIKNRPKNPWRFNEHFSDFLRYKYKGSLPKDIISLARRFGYDDYLVGLFSYTEDRYKEIFRDYYDNFFNNRSMYEKNMIFQSSDYGARSVFELQQDTVASNIFEDMLKFHSFCALRENKEATGRESNYSISTKSDLIYDIIHNNEHIEIPIEIKTKWKRYLNSDEKVSIRGNSLNISKDNGMILSLYLSLDDKEYGGVKGILIDTCDNNIITQGKMSVTNKSSDDFHVRKEDIVNFNFWEENDMRNMLNMIYLKYKERN